VKGTGYILDKRMRASGKEITSHLSMKSLHSLYVIQRLLIK
jgi:hypothetical protein